MTFTGLSISANSTTVDNIPCLGEIESITESDLGFSFEGDMGFIEVKANQHSVEKAS
ncbi:hypothetical protein [Marinomonas transparens]|uniref:Uncharacterized protein n=1 Tax=Marinomonas transparens TaxID=2795388 RepID=A0A934MXU7_9GAMM|nr:hypothetical protein [Marinomonas transparens]MBJ7539694.1 hypothetical protein [Marinomonas transparens]